MGPVPRDFYALKRDRGLTNVFALNGPDPVVLSPGALAGGLHVPVLGTATVPAGGTFGTRIDGTLTDTLGAPLSGQMVKLSARTPSGRVTVYAITQADGSYRVENLPAGLYRVTATVPPLHQRVSLHDVPIGESTRARLDLLAQAF
jgi:hypothetical protein